MEQAKGGDIITVSIYNYDNEFREANAGRLVEQIEDRMEG